MVAHEVRYGSSRAAGEGREVVGDVLRCAGAEQREHLGQVVGLPVAEAARASGRPACSGVTSTTLTGVPVSAWMAAAICA